MANYFYGRLGLQYMARKNLYLQGNFNYLNSDVSWLYPDVDAGKLGDRTMRFGYSGSIGFSSPIGPVSFLFAKDHFRKEWKASLVIGFYY
jgi:outer membrane translocation and assembly module TamA